MVYQDEPEEASEPLGITYVSIFVEHSSKSVVFVGKNVRSLFTLCASPPHWPGCAWTWSGGTSLIDNLLTYMGLSGSRKRTGLTGPWKGGHVKLSSPVDSPCQAMMSIKHLNVCHKLGPEKTQPRVTPLSCCEFHSFQETPFRNKQMFCDNCANEYNYIYRVNKFLTIITCFAAFCIQFLTEITTCFHVLFCQKAHRRRGRSIHVFTSVRCLMPRAEGVVQGLFLKKILTPTLH